MVEQEKNIKVNHVVKVNNNENNGNNLWVK